MENVNEEIKHEVIDPRTYLLRKAVLSLQETCVYLSISQSYMYKLTSTRKIPHYSPLGKLIYFKRQELDEWVFSNKRCSKEELEGSAHLYMRKGMEHI